MATLQQEQAWEKLTRLSRHESLSSHWTTGLAERWYWILVILVTLFHLVAARTLPLLEEEFVYWNVGQTFQMAYAQSPPLIAWVVGFSTKLFGNTPLGIRFPSALACFLLLILLGRMSRGKLTLELLIFTPAVMFLPVYMTPLLFLAFFWVLYLLWLQQACAGLNQWEADPIARVYHKGPLPIYQWLLGGIILGLGFLASSGMWLALVAGFIMLLTSYRSQAWLVGFVAQLGAAFIVTFPLWVYAAQNGFEPIGQWFTASFFPEFFSFRHAFRTVAEIALLVGAVPFILFPWVLFRPKGVHTDPVTDTNYYFFLIPGLYFAYRALTSNIAPPEILLAFLSIWALVQKIIETSSFRGLMKTLALAGFSVAWVASIIVIVHWRSPWNFIAATKDPLYRHKASNTVLASIASEWKDSQAPVFNAASGLGPGLKFFGLSSLAFDETEVCNFDSVVVISDRSPAAIACFGEAPRVKSYAYVVRGELLGYYNVAQYNKPDETPPPE